MDRPRVGRHPAVLHGDLLLVETGQVRSPGRVAPGLEPPVGSFEKLVQHPRHVAGQTDVRRPVASDLRGVDVDLDHLRLRAPSGRTCEIDHVVLPGADDEDEVRLPKGGAAGAEEAEWMILRDDTPALRGRVEGDAGTI